MNFRPAIFASIAVAASAFCPLAVRADTATLGVLKDTTIFQNNVNNSSGGGPGLFAGTNGSGSPRRFLIQFNVAGSIPAGATITGVAFNLTIGQLAGSGGGAGGNTTPRTINLFDLSSDWGEGSVGASTTIGGTGQGAAAKTGDATWNARTYSATAPTNWTTPGGDHAAFSSAGLTLAAPTVNTTYTWSSAGLVSDVQNWLDNSTSNHGWELINSDESTFTNFLAFYSKDGLAAAGGNAGYLPQLSIAYSLPAAGVPEPGPALLVTLVLFGMTLAKPARNLAARRRRTLG